MKKYLVQKISNGIRLIRVYTKEEAKLIIENEEYELHDGEIIKINNKEFPIFTVI
jgi:hypothetical protein